MSSLTIPNNECLQYIYVQAESLKIVESLSLSNLPELIFFITEVNSFYKTTSLSMLRCLYERIE